MIDLSQALLLSAFLGVFLIWGAWESGRGRFYSGHTYRVTETTKDTFTLIPLTVVDGARKTEGRKGMVLNVQDASGYAVGNVVNLSLPEGWWSI